MMRIIIALLVLITLSPALATPQSGGNELVPRGEQAGALTDYNETVGAGYPPTVPDAPVTGGLYCTPCGGPPSLLDASTRYMLGHEYDTSDASSTVYENDDPPRNNDCIAIPYEVNTQNDPPGAQPTKDPSFTFYYDATDHYTMNTITMNFTMLSNITSAESMCLGFYEYDMSCTQGNDAQCPYYIRAERSGFHAGQSYQLVIPFDWHQDATSRIAWGFTMERVNGTAGPIGITITDMGAYVGNPFGGGTIAPVVTGDWGTPLAMAFAVIGIAFCFIIIVKETLTR